MMVVLDETSVLWNPLSRYTLEEKGAKRVIVKVDDKKKAPTALLWGCAKLTYDEEGKPIISEVAQGDPFVILKGTPGAKIEKDVKACIQRKNLALTAGVSINGWMNEKLFLNFIDSLPSVDGEQAWLVLDLFNAHRTQSVLNKLKQKKYTTFFIPPGCTSVKQVHDVYVNKPFKDAITNWYGKHNIENGKKVTREDVCNMVRHAMTCVPISTIENGMKTLILDAATKEEKRSENKIDAKENS
jgi:hypothetical protein